MSPEYEKLIDLIKEDREDVIIARLEGSINEDISSTYEILSYPKVVLFYPRSHNIKKIFRENRTSSSLFNWIQLYAPKLEKKLEFLDNSKNENKEQNKYKNNDEKIINISNTTNTYDIKYEALNPSNNITEEIDILKTEIMNMKIKIINFQQEIENLKNHTLNLLEIKNNDFNNTFDNSSQDDILVRLKKIIDKKKIIYGIFDKITIFDIFLYLGVIAIIIGAVLIFKKILSKRGKIKTTNDHAKI
jgi:hypothetical protein